MVARDEAFTMRFACIVRAAAFAAAVALSGPVAAEGMPVDLELVIAVDVSGSIDPVEARLQREGYYAAFTNQKVIRAIQSGVLGRIAVCYMEWAGSHYQRTVLDWTLIDNQESAQQFIAKLGDIPPTTQRWTSISGAIDYAMTLFTASPFSSNRRVLDISGDGSNNNGRSVVAARDEAVKAGVIINGLPVMNDRPSQWGMAPEPDLDKYYEQYVIGGPGAFIIIAD